MALSSTYLTSDLSASSNTMVVNSGTGFPTAGSATPVGYLVRIDGEFMYAVTQPVAGTIKLRSRGAEGTAAVAHDTLARVYVSAAPSDFEGVPIGNVAMLPPSVNLQQTIGEDITYSATDVASWSKNQNFVIQKASAAAIVLVAPSVAQNGVELFFTSATAAAHVITATALLGSGGASSPYTTATFAAKIGAGFVLVANDGIWNVKSSPANVTLT